MNHMQGMDHSAHFMAPEWLLYSIAALFFAGACFYLYRLLRASTVKAVYGWYDWENEIGHGICMLAMASALAPPFLQLPAMFWAITLSLSGGWFLVRALTWGRKLPYNKWWSDWAHVGMCLGMALMFYPLNLGAWFVYLQQAFWLWFAGYYAYETYHDLKKPKALYIGSDLSHLAMGVVMFIMTTCPVALMPMHHNMPGMGNMPGMDVPAVNQLAPAGVVVANDSNFHAEVFTSQQPVVVLFFGSCEKCAQEVHIFDDLAKQLGNRAKFVRINKDGNPNACQLCGVTECPRVMIVSKGSITAAPSTIDVTDKQQLEEFIVNHVQ